MRTSRDMSVAAGLRPAVEGGILPTGPNFRAGSSRNRDALRGCWKTPAPRRVRARGLQETTEIAMRCRPGALTGRVFKHAVRIVLLLGSRECHSQTRRNGVSDNYRHARTNVDRFAS